MQQLAVSTQSFMTAKDMNFKNQAAAIHSLKVQTGQILNLLTNRPQGSLSNNTEMNPNEHVKAVMLRSGKILEQNQDSRAKEDMTKTLKQKEKKDRKLLPEQRRKFGWTKESWVGQPIFLRSRGAQNFCREAKSQILCSPTSISSEAENKQYK